MKNYKYENPYARCPFYKSETVKYASIHCEGVLEGTVLHLAFDSSEKMKAYRNKYCCDINNCHRCMIFDMLDYNKYNWGDEQCKRS